MLIKKAKDMNDSHGIKAILYGASGVGKTTQVKTLVDSGYKVLVISAESGLLSLGQTDVDVIDLTVDERGDKVKPENRFENLVKAYNFLETGKHKYDTIVLDSLTEINQVLLEYLRTKYPDAKNTLQMYGENSLVMNKMVKKFRDLPYNVILIALESLEKDEVGRRFIVMDLVGKVANGIPPLFDEVIYMFIEEKGDRKFLTNKTEKLMAKDRSGRLDQVEVAHLGNLLNKIRKPITKENKNV
jgi:phage nucleotide-binding protein